MVAFTINDAGFQASFARQMETAKRPRGGFGGGRARGP
jgi:hypothetical protein